MYQLGLSRSSAKSSYSIRGHHNHVTEVSSMTRFKRPQDKRCMARDKTNFSQLQDQRLRTCHSLETRTINGLTSNTSVIFTIMRLNFSQKQAGTEGRLEIRITLTVVTIISAVSTHERPLIVIKLKEVASTQTRIATCCSRLTKTMHTTGLTCKLTCGQLNLFKVSASAPTT